VSVDLQSCVAAERQWGCEAVAAGWLSPEDVAPLESFDVTEPGALFGGSIHRPLVAAFFGGTGVGKSSLLNRLAREPVARVGVERPTSREVSVYLHESVELARLPGEFPVDRVRIARHRDAAGAPVLWIDMPDMDSIEAANRALALAWLPHIDVVIYVVSPERYRDDKGWRLLVQHGRRHAWLFVMNQIDRADPVQTGDFLRQLQRAGFQQPVVLRTDCQPEIALRQPDDFTQLEALLRQLADEHAFGQLQRHAARQAREALQERLARCAERLDTVAELEKLRQCWAQTWREATASIRDGQEWAIRATAGVLASGGPNANSGVLWDEWAQSGWEDALGRLTVEAGQHGWPIRRVRGALTQLPAQARAVVLTETRLTAAQTLARPGGRWRRGLSRLSGAAIGLLPLAAAAWVAARAVSAWRVAGETGSAHDYLGAEFVIHGALLIGLATLLPWLLNRALRPNLQRLAEGALRRGLENALARLEREALAALEPLEEERRRMTETAAALQATCTAEATDAPAPPAGLLKQVWQQDGQGGLG
jgi:hypothetical protein